VRRLVALSILASIAVAWSQTTGSPKPPPAEWVPAEWHSHDLTTLDLLKDTPVNCILLEPSDWDAAFIGAARKRGLVALGVLRAGTDAGSLVRRAASAKLTGVVALGDFEASPMEAATGAGLVSIELPTRARIRLDSKEPIAGTSQGLWPGLEIEHNGKSITGPTSAPWINTNGGFLRFLRARTGATVWLAVDPPPGMVFPVERYLQAIGDTAIPGARWVVSLDSDLEGRLYRHDPAAMKDWQRIAEYLRFYERWRQAANFGKFGVVMDRKTGGLLSGFLLDMLAAQRTSANVIPPGRVSADALQRVNVLLDLDSASLSPEERKAIQDFVARGGTVLDPPPAVRFPEPSPRQMTPDRRDLDRLQGLWEMVYNATLRKNFGVRAFNTAGILTGVVTPDGGRTVLVHLLNFTDYPMESITVHALGTWKRARLYRPDGPAKDLAVYPVKEGTAVDIEGFGTSVAIHFE
jgi:hypothetical protein